jgi:hypothetical protein
LQWTSISDESARALEHVTQLLTERINSRLQPFLPFSTARRVFGSGLREIGLDPGDLVLEFVVGHVRQGTAEHHAAERVHARVDELRRLFVDLGDQRGSAGLELVLDVNDEVAADASPRDVGRRSEDKAGRAPIARPAGPPIIPINPPTAAPPIVPSGATSCVWTTRVVPSGSLVTTLSALTAMKLSSASFSRARDALCAWASLSKTTTTIRCMSQLH